MKMDCREVQRAKARTENLRILAPGSKPSRDSEHEEKQECRIRSTDAGISMDWSEVQSEKAEAPML
jgi:hypothetical protein